ncbi:hypothetical protein HK096_011394 [Nowakowskiella sp. JEL0078]|nr:hypothetical protein HK096_011394 [Nowakowskiella sp. JEL0078]
MIKSLPALNNLRRLLLSSNFISQLFEIQELFKIPHLTELTLESNPVTSDSFHRMYIINGMRTLKIFDGKRISEEERRNALKMTKREIEKRKESERLSMQSEERVLKAIKMKWENDFREQNTEVMQPGNDEVSTISHIELQNGHLLM